MSEDPSPDPETWLGFLDLLQDDPPARVIGRLRRALDDHDTIAFREEPRSPGESLRLRGDAHLVPDGAHPLDVEFFRWWVREFKRRRRRATDALTGLYDRSTWNRTLRSTVAGEGPCWVILADVDHFKRFNDRYGHDTGDEVLRNLGSFLRRELDDGDLAVRYGGEEFLIVPGEGDRTPERIESIRRSLGERVLFEGQPEAVTLSVGMARYGGTDEDDLGEAIERADRALYHSKAEGRDRSTRFAPYLRHRERLSTWGLYRYLPDSGVRFCPGGSNEFLIADGSTVARYDWLENTPFELGGPTGTIPRPIRQIVHAGGTYWLLDGDGQPWTVRDGTARPAARDREIPVLVDLLEAGSTALAVGLDNGLYSLQPDVRRRRSLPSRWDQVAWLGFPYTVDVDCLVGWPESGEKRSWELPAPARQLLGLEDSLILLAETGKLYRFQPSVHRWIQVLLPELNGRRVVAREMAGGGDRLLIRDDRGRLLYLSWQSKAVPQSMELGGVLGEG